MVRREGCLGTPTPTIRTLELSYDYSRLLTWVFIQQMKPTRDPNIKPLHLPASLISLYQAQAAATCVPKSGLLNLGLRALHPKPGVGLKELKSSGTQCAQG